MKFLSNLAVASFYMFSFVHAGNAALRPVVEGITFLDECTVIFDFDGVICASFDSVFDIMKNFANYYGYRKPDGSEVFDDDKEFFRGMSALEVCSYLKMSFLARAYCCYQVRQYLSNCIDSLQPVPGICDLIKRLTNQGCRLIILTSNSKENVRKFLDKHNLQNYFPDVYSGSIWSMFGKHRILNSIASATWISGRREYSSKLDKIIYIGDEVRDAEAVENSCIKNCILLSTQASYNNEEALKKAIYTLPLKNAFNATAPIIYGRSVSDLSSPMLKSYKLAKSADEIYDLLFPSKA